MNVTSAQVKKRGRPKGSETLREVSYKDANPDGLRRGDSFLLAEHIRFRHSVLKNKNGTAWKDTGYVLTHKAIKKLENKRGGPLLKNRSKSSITRTITEITACGEIFRIQATEYDPKTRTRKYGPNVFYPGSCGRKELEERYDRLIREDLEKKGLRNKRKAARKTPTTYSHVSQTAREAATQTAVATKKQKTSLSPAKKAESKEDRDERLFREEYGDTQADPAMLRQMQDMLKGNRQDE